jgi:isorenieratene synthase
MERDVTVIGGGLAGVSAAVVLAERGLSVSLVERERFLGGRAGAWTETLADGASFEMERGFHAFFRHYHNVRALIRRVDPSLSILTPLDDYPLLGPGGAKESFSGLPKTTPLNILELVRRSPTIRFWDLRHADLKVARSLLAFDPIDTYARLDTTTAKDFLDGLRFPPKARQMLFDVFAHSFFNPDDDYSAAELCAMFHYYFTRNPEGARVRRHERALQRRPVPAAAAAPRAPRGGGAARATAERVEREGTPTSRASRAARARASAAPDPSCWR